MEVAECRLVDKYAFSVSPPLPSRLLEPGEEWWGKYPEFFQQGFRPTCRTTALHEKYLSDDYFPCLGSVPKKFTGKNRRRIDMNIARFENETEKKVDRTEWGLPVPNVEAAYISLGKYAKDIPALDTCQVTAMNVAFQWTERHFGPYMQNSRVKTQEEVVEGLDFSTSPGFPWTRKYAKKRNMCDDWKEFPTYMRDDWERLRDPLYVAVFGNSLKEEIRPRVKIDANSIRTFTAGPIEMTIHGNRLFEDMNQKFYASHLKTASVVGFTPLKGGWDMLYRKLRKHPNGFALDESQYDSSLRAYLMWGCAQFRWNMLRPEDQTEDMKERLLMYYQNLVNTVILTSDGVFVRKTGGNPSGSVNTISDNTLILFMLLAYGWIMVSPDEFANYESFMAHVSLALCGDDNTWSVSNIALPFFNARSLIAEWSRIGVTTTTDSLDPRPIEELDFLSAFTVFIDGIACPLYSRHKILTSLLYSREPESPAYTLIRSCALLRVGWPDPQLRGYLKELISWIVKEYGTVLQGTEEWRQAMCQIPTEMELKKLFLGDSQPMVKQSKNCSCVDPGIKKIFQNEMNQQARPQRKKSQRMSRAARRGQRGTGRSRLIGPRMPQGNFLSGGRRMPISVKQRRNRRRNGGAVKGAGNLVLAGKPFGMGAQNRSGGQRRVKRVQNDEFIGTVTSGTGGVSAFNNVVFPVNPGNATTFPWLAGEAQQWEKYRFEYLEFYFEHDVSAFATAGTTGKVIMSFDYDAADSPPTTKQQMLDTEPHADGMPNEDFGLVMNTGDLSGRTDLHYVRLAGLPGGADIRLYDVGNMNVATQGITGATTEVGELHVRYAVVFEVPILSSDLKAAPANNQVSWFQSSAAEASGANGVAKNLLMATATANGLAIVNTAGSFVLPAGNYIADLTAVMQDTLATFTATSLDVLKNGVSVYTAALIKPSGGDSSGSLTNELVASVFLSSNGTDAFVFPVTNVYTTGTTTQAGSLRFVAV